MPFILDTLFFHYVLFSYLSKLSSVKNRLIFYLEFCLQDVAGGKSWGITERQLALLWGRQLPLFEMVE